MVGQTRAAELPEGQKRGQKQSPKMGLLSIIA